MIITPIEHGGEGDLAHVAKAIGCLGPLLCLAQRRQQHARQDRDDRDYDQQFNQGEPISLSSGSANAKWPHGMVDLDYSSRLPQLRARSSMVFAAIVIMAVSK